MTEPESVKLLPCQHIELQFNSGDYYVACHQCNARWGRISSTRPEYGFDAKDNPIGCAPEEANQGFNDVDQFRRRAPVAGPAPRRSSDTLRAALEEIVKEVGTSTRAAKIAREAPRGSERKHAGS